MTADTQQPATAREHELTDAASLSALLAQVGLDVAGPAARARSIRRQLDAIRLDRIAAHAPGPVVYRLTQASHAADEATHALAKVAQTLATVTTALDAALAEHDRTHIAAGPILPATIPADRLALSVRDAIRPSRIGDDREAAQ